MQNFRSYKGRIFLLLILLVVTALVQPASAKAQDGEDVITLVVSEFMQDFITEEVIQRFEDANPGIKVQVKNTGQTNFIASPAYGIEDYLEGGEAYVIQGDVIYLPQNSVTPEATRAGYLLDLKPFIQADPSFNSADFYPAAREAYHWDNGIWGIPFALDVVVLAYDPAAFDAAGLPYPNGAWTMDDLANAARALTQRDANGTVTQAGLIDYGNYVTYLMRSLAGTGFFTDDALAASPLFTGNPVLESLLTSWVELQSEGVIGGSGDGTVLIGGETTTPLALTQSFGLASFPGQETPLRGSLLPGGKTGVIAQGFGVSAGTLYPEESYRLVKFLSEQPELANSFLGVRPARTSLLGTEANGESDFALALSPENEAIIDEAIANGLPLSQMRFADYLMQAITKMTQNGLDSISALQETELEAVSNLQMASARREEGVVTVATPIPEVPLAPGEIALDFGIVSFVSPLPNQQAWEQLASEFAASDPEVGKVNIDTARDSNLETLTAEYECFYMSNNAVQGGNISGLLDLTPFMRDDATIDENDFVGNSLAQVQVDSRYYALPIAIMPEILSLNPDKFTQYGAALPSGTWTVDAFVDTLRTLKPTAEDTAPFVPGFAGDNSLLMLIAAYGGLPIDYRTTPPTINFTDPATVDAIRQVLDLAKAGYIKYDGLSRSGGGFAIAFGGGNTDAIAPRSMSMPVFSTQPGTSQPALYPRGSQYIPLSYDMGTAYISVNAQNPAACYRWISTLARRQDLFTNMPARHSLINDPALSAAVGEQNVALYREFAALMSDPNAIAFPTPFGQGDAGSFMLRTWLHRAFDAYVFEDADLAAELAEAETFTRAYQQCIAAIPPFDAMTYPNPQDYFQQFLNCSITVDPSLAQ